MKSKLELSEFRGMGTAELSAKADSLKEELMKLRFRHSTGQLENTARLGALRKSVARVRSALKEKQG